MKTHTIKRGFDIRLAGVPEAKLDPAVEPKRVGVAPPEFPDLRAKVVVAEGDEVKTGDVLFFDKTDPDVQFLSPATGTVSTVELGPRRAPQSVEITLSGDDDFATIETVDRKDLATIERGELITKLKKSGLWPLLRQRPVGKLCKADSVPAAIYVNGMDTEPLSADPAVACMGLGAELQAGVDLLRRLTEGKVYLTVNADRAVPYEFGALKGVEVHGFSGPHPAGLVGTHIFHVAPLGEGQVVWCLKAQQAAVLGAWVLGGQYPTMRTVAVSGTGAPSRQYYRVRQGAPLSTLTGGQPVEGDFRLINGTVLSGVATHSEGLLGYYANTVTVLPAGTDKRDLFGWALPQLGKYSASRSFLSGILPKREYDLDARLNGGKRAMVNIGTWDKVVPLDIYPTYLVRAIQAGDIEEALNLGLLEVTEEDVALCTFSDPCKTEVGEIIRRGLDLYEKEA